MDPGKLFIGGISWDTTEDSLREYFQTFGEVIEAVIMKDRTTGRARGFGFVVFLNPNVAERVVKEKHIIDGRTVEAKKAVPRDDQQTINRSNNGSIHGSPIQTSSKKIFVGGLASTVTESDFKNYFDQFGMITDVVVMYDHNTQRPRGFGFITYKSEESVDKVLLKTFHELNGKMVEVKRAVPKELSPGHNRNFGLTRVNSFLNGYSPRTDGRFSSVSGVRGGFPLFSLSNVGPNSDSGLGANYGGNGIGNSGVGYGRVLNPSFSVGANRHAMGGVGIGTGNGIGNASLMSSLNYNIWGNTNGNQNYMNTSLGDSFAPGIGIGGNGAIWGNLDSDQGGIGGSSSFIGYRRNGGNGIAPPSLYGDIDGGGGGRSGGGGGDLFSGDTTWRPLSPELEVPGFFGYDFGNGSNRGIAA